MTLKVSPAATVNENGFLIIEVSVNDECTAADDGGGEGTTVGCTTALGREGELDVAAEGVNLSLMLCTQPRPSASWKKAAEAGVPSGRL